MGLPILSTPMELAQALGLTIPRLRWLAFHTESATVSHYIRFTIPKRSGGTRTLFRPHRTLATAQRWIFENITSKLPVEPPVHGFVTGRSILSNAREHAGQAIVVNLDLSDFFPSIGFPRVRSVFQRAGYSPAVATILALLCTECPRRDIEYDGVKYHVATGPRGLPQGACTSPGLSNQVARRLDRRLSGLAQKLGIKYTRYADDLTFSGSSEIEGRVGYLMARVRHIAQDEGFVVNEAKSRVLRQSTAQVVTGLVVNDRPGVARGEVRRLRAILHRAKTEGLARQNRQEHPDFIAWLRGKIAFVSMARPEVGAALRAELAAVLGNER
jgi:retron-type reverse transcriptase